MPLQSCHILIMKLWVVNIVDRENHGSQLVFFKKFLQTVPAEGFAGSTHHQIPTKFSLLLQQHDPGDQVDPCHLERNSSVVFQPVGHDPPVGETLLKLVRSTPV